MSEALPEVYLARHGETAWTVASRHTGRTDLPLTERGERNAASLGARLRGMTFDPGPGQPARAGPPDLRAGRLRCAGAEVLPDLTEWDYGEYEGRRTAEIRAERPGWYLFRDGCPGGESVADVGARADRVIARLREAGGPHPAVRPRPLLPRAGGPVDRAAPRGRVPPAVEHGLPQHPELRAHPGRPGRPALERRPARGALMESRRTTTPTRESRRHETDPEDPCPDRFLAPRRGGVPRGPRPGQATRGERHGPPRGSATGRGRRRRPAVDDPAEGEPRTLWAELRRSRPTYPAVGVEHEVIVADRPDASHVLKIVEKTGCDLIVMGTHGLTGLEAPAVRQPDRGGGPPARCPVMVVKDLATPASGPCPGPRRRRRDAEGRKPAAPPEPRKARRNESPHTRWHDAEPPASNPPRPPRVSGPGPPGAVRVRADPVLRRPDASYERHLVLDHVVQPGGRHPAERFEALAWSLRDLLSQRWLKTGRSTTARIPSRSTTFRWSSSTPSPFTATTTCTWPTCRPT